ncbi:thiopeptide-type bacteriocin biosynthesis protein [Streptomyces sp. NPDC017546]|uniref:thiopeptide-type bacteriocin biosynthesis protein n=1 Tax=unclassified Streptomyces TaxID=2593676 RepID=UPI0023626F38|nr:thiopeptide-type bacteriocin biosynthesis protein [Streptomyces sp. MMBL 11-1]
MTDTSETARAGDGDTGSGTVWRTWHLHVSSGDRSVHDRVLVEAVVPLIHTLPDRPWFFLRYWHGGPHVRLRVGDLTDEQAASAERLLAERLADAGRLREGETAMSPADYARTASSMTTAGDQPSHQEVTGMLEPGVHRFAYHPEYERYGGRELLPESERLFELSSRLVLSFLRRGPSAGARALLALRATVCAGRALGDDPAEEAAFYDHGLRAWRTWAAGYGYTERQLDELYRAARPTDELRAKVAGGDTAGPLAPWQAALTGLSDRIRRETPLHPAQVTVSHVHMLHNRLGLRAVEEYQTYARLARLFPVRSAPEGAPPSDHSGPAQSGAVLTPEEHR